MTEVAHSRPPTDQTFSAAHFAEVVRQWPSDDDLLGYIAEAAMQGDGHGYQHFGQMFAIEGKEIVATFPEGDVRRTDAAEFLAVVEQDFPTQFAKAEAEFAKEQMATTPVVEHEAMDEIEAMLGIEASEPSYDNRSNSADWGPSYDQDATFFQENSEILHESAQHAIDTGVVSAHDGWMKDMADYLATEQGDGVYRDSAYVFRLNGSDGNIFTIENVATGEKAIFDAHSVVASNGKSDVRQIVERPQGIDLVAATSRFEATEAARSASSSSAPALSR